MTEKSINFTFKLNIEAILERILPLEHFPSLALKRFRGIGGQNFYFSNGRQSLRIRPPNPLNNKQQMATLWKRYKQDEEWSRDYQDALVDDVTTLPHVHLIDINEAKVSQSEFSGEDVTIITEIYPESEGNLIKTVVYVRLAAGGPQVFREAFYYQSQSSQMDEDGFWLRSVYDYRDFEKVENLNIAVPKVKEMKEFRDVDGFMRFHSIITVKERNFNVGFPTNFFDWDESELTDDKGMRESIRGEVQDDDKSLRKGNSGKTEE